MNRRTWFGVTLAGVYAAATVRANQPGGGEGSIPRSHLIAPDAKLEEVARGFRFTEGPVADKHGDIWFTDIPNNRIHRYSVAHNQTTVEYENTGGANGLAFDRQGRLIACQGTARQLVRYDGDGGITTLADVYEGAQLNSPNDLVIDDQGGIYFTDPRYGNRDNMRMRIEGVYYLDRRGQLMRVIDDLQRPNGVMLSPGGETLYVADEAARRIYAYDVRADGTLVNKRLFANTGDNQPGGADGLTVDERGNVYAACPNGIIIWNTRGEHQTTIPVPGRPTNCTFGGLDGRELFITAGGSLYRIKMTVAGR
mgnify:CR=1 FL=1